MNDYTGLSGAAFLQRWHAEYPGATAEQFGAARVDGRGVSSYDLLVSDLAEAGPLDDVLDVACGDGFLLGRIAQKFPGARLTGIDASSFELALARHRRAAFACELIEGRVNDMPFQSASFDAATCHMALMLFEEAGAALREIARVLRSDGRFMAVLGPAPGASEAVRRFGSKLNELERVAGLAPLKIGDAALNGGLRALFDERYWRSVSIEMFVLDFGDSEDRVLAMLMGMYNISRLSESARNELRAFALREMREEHGDGSVAEWKLRLCHVVARRM